MPKQDTGIVKSKAAVSKSLSKVVFERSLGEKDVEHLKVKYGGVGLLDVGGQFGIDTLIQYYE